MKIFNSVKMLTDININSTFDIITDTKTIPGFFQPFVCSCFIGNEEIFCNFFIQSA